MKRSDYRKFRVRTRLHEGPDDFAAMREVVQRRYRALLEAGGPFPDLILIDGGIGQVSAAYDALESIGLANLVAVGIAKREELLVLRDRPDPVALPRTDPALLLVQRIRDEAHRFAVTFHRKARSMRDLRSELDDVPGIGPRRRRVLLRHFGSLAGVRRATNEELTSVVGPKVARAVLEYFARVAATPAACRVAVRLNCVPRGDRSARPATQQTVVVRSLAHVSPQKSRVVSGMRPTGRLHLGHLMGALKNWTTLQEQYDCYYFVADWHALTSDYASTAGLSANGLDNVVDWLAAGVDPARSTIFVQSLVPEHAELYLLLSMVVPDPVARARADLQGTAGTADREGLVHAGLPGLSAAADGRRGHVRRALRARRRGPGPASRAGPRGGPAVQQLLRRGAGRSPAAAHARVPASGTRQPEDEQELRQHDRPVRRRGRGHEEGPPDVHGPQARARRHSRHGGRQPGLHLP